MKKDHEETFSPGKDKINVTPTKLGYYYQKRGYKKYKKYLEKKDNKNIIWEKLKNFWKKFWKKIIITAPAIIIIIVNLEFVIKIIKKISEWIF